MDIWQVWSVVLGILEPHDLVIEVSLEDWGHGLVGPMRLISHFGETIRVEYMKFDENRAVDAESLKANGNGVKA